MQRQFVERPAEIDLSAERIVKESTRNFCLDAKILPLDGDQHLNCRVFAFRRVEVDVIVFRVHLYIIKVNEAAINLSPPLRLIIRKRFILQIIILYV